MYDKTNDWMLTKNARQLIELDDLMISGHQDEYSIEEIERVTGWSRYLATNNLGLLIDHIARYMPEQNQMIEWVEPQKVARVNRNHYPFPSYLRYTFFKQSAGAVYLYMIMTETFTTVEDFAHRMNLSTTKIRQVMHEVDEELAKSNIQVDQHYRLIGDEIQIRHWSHAILYQMLAGNEVFMASIKPQLSKADDLREMVARLFVSFNRTMTAAQKANIGYLMAILDLRYRGRHIADLIRQVDWTIDETKLSAKYLGYLSTIRETLNTAYPYLTFSQVETESMYILINVLLIVDDPKMHDFWADTPSEKHFESTLDFIQEAYTDFFGLIIARNQLAQMRELLFQPVMYYSLYGSAQNMYSWHSEVVSTEYPIVAQFTHAVLERRAEALNDDVNHLRDALYMEFFSTFIQVLNIRQLLAPVKILISFTGLSALKKYVMDRINGVGGVLVEFTDDYDADIDFVISDTSLGNPTAIETFVWHTIPNEDEWQRFIKHAVSRSVLKFNVTYGHTIQQEVPVCTMTDESPAEEA